MKVFYYFTLSGNGDMVASVLAESGIECRKVELSKPFPKSKFLAIMKGGFAASIKRKESVQDYNKDVSAFDEVVIGSPIWNGRFSTPINTVLSDLDLTGKKVSFVLYSASGEAKKAVERIEAEYPGSKYVIVKEPKKNENLKELLAEV